MCCLVCLVIFVEMDSPNRNLPGLNTPTGFGGLHAASSSPVKADMSKPVPITTSNARDALTTISTENATLPIEFITKFTDVMAGLSDKLHRKDYIEPAVFVLGSAKSLEEFFVDYEKFMNDKYGSGTQFAQLWAERLGSFLSGSIKNVYEGMKSVGMGYVKIKSSLLDS